MVRTITAVCIFTLFVLALASVSHAASPSYPFPSSINPSAKYLFYYHNYYVEAKGPDGDCKYYDILKSFADQGFTVISAIRPKDASVVEYAKSGAAEVRKLLDAHVPPENITVAGHSKGAAIAIRVASLVDSKKINYVIMAGCGIKGLEKAYPNYSELKGNLLSILAASDKVAGSCNAAFSEAKGNVTGTEVVLDSPAGHQLFFKPVELWVSPVMSWLKHDK